MFLGHPEHKYEFPLSDCLKKKVYCNLTFYLQNGLFQKIVTTRFAIKSHIAINLLHFRNFFFLSST